VSQPVSGEPEPIDGQSDRRAIEAITFDFWNTMVAEGAAGPDRSARWTAAIERAGHRVSVEQLERSMTDLWSWFVGQWEGNVVVSPRQAVLQAVELLGVPPESELVADMEAVLHEGTDPSTLTLAPGLGDVLEGLRHAGVRLGIICDVGLSPSSTLRGYLEHHGVLGHFDAWSFSDDVGCYKPDRRIFDHANIGLGGVPAAATVHVGDLRRTDVAGARAAGWTAVRFSGFFDDPAPLPDADTVISSHHQLIELVEARR
jgi:putative hydrolase of the HAD superfamily